MCCGFHITEGSARKTQGHTEQLGGAGISFLESPLISMAEHKSASSFLISQDSPSPNPHTPTALPNEKLRVSLSGGLSPLP